jgi:SAM-dependent methyltransferase
MKSSGIEKLIREEFSSPYTLEDYSEKARDGLWSSEEIMVNKYFVKKKAKILDMGCGTGRTSGPLSRKGHHVIGIDIIPEFILIARNFHPKIKFSVMDAKKMSFPDEFFDYAFFSFNGWEQIPEEQNRLAALKEIHRVLKPDGTYIFTTHKRALNIKWIKRWFSFHISKLMGRETNELEYGDYFWKRGTNDKLQYIHISSLNRVRSLLKRSGFRLLELKSTVELGDVSHEYVYYFFVCQKLP